VPFGEVYRVEGEPELGVVSAIVVDSGAFTVARRASVGQIASTGVGVVRLNVTLDALQPA